MPISSISLLTESDTGRRLCLCRTLLSELVSELLLLLLLGDLRFLCLAFLCLCGASLSESELSELSEECFRFLCFRFLCLSFLCFS